MGKSFPQKPKATFFHKFLSKFLPYVFFPSVPADEGRAGRGRRGGQCRGWLWQGATDVVIEFASSSIKWRKLLASGIQLGGVACAFFICLSQCSIQFAPLPLPRPPPACPSYTTVRCLALFAAGPLFLTVCEMKVTCHGVAKKEREGNR